MTYDWDTHSHEAESDGGQEHDNEDDLAEVSWSSNSFLQIETLRVTHPEGLRSCLADGFIVRRSRYDGWNWRNTGMAGDRAGWNEQARGLDEDFHGIHHDGCFLGRCCFCVTVSLDGEERRGNCDGKRWKKKIGE